MPLAFGSAGVRVTSGKGTALLPKEEFGKIVQSQTAIPDSFGIPPGVVGLWYNRPNLVILHEQPPRVFECRWIAPNSPSGYGSGTTYRQRTLSWPWIYSITHLSRARNGYLFCNMEAYGRTQKLHSLDDVIQGAPMLNNSVVAGHGWVCTQYLKARESASWPEILDQAIEHMWYGGFNLSSEGHEGESWYGRCLDEDERFEIDSWEKSSKSPGAVLEYRLPDIESTYQGRINELLGGSLNTEEILIRHCMENRLFKLKE